MCCATRALRFLHHSKGIYFSGVGQYGRYTNSTISLRVFGKDFSLCPPPPTHTHTYTPHTHGRASALLNSPHLNMSLCAKWLSSRRMACTDNTACTENALAHARSNAQHTVVRRRWCWSVGVRQCAMQACTPRPDSATNLLMKATILGALFFFTGESLTSRMIEELSPVSSDLPPPPPP